MRSIVSGVGAMKCCLDCTVLPAGWLSEVRVECMMLLTTCPVWECFYDSPPPPQTAKGGQIEKQNV